MLPANIPFLPLFSSAAAIFPPKLSTSPLPLAPSASEGFQRTLRCSFPDRINLSRRDTILFSVIGLIPSLQLIQTNPAAAFSFGISGPKDWLRDQKKKSAKFLLAPIDSSRNILRTAYLLLKNATDNGDKDMEEVRKLLRSAARDCVAEERDTFVSFQARTGVEVCTFRLIVNNASSLLDDKDPIKLNAEADLSELIRLFASLNDVANNAEIQLLSDRRKVADALEDTISSLDKFELGIKNCLEI